MMAIAMGFLLRYSTANKNQLPVLGAGAVYVLRRRGAGAGAGCSGVGWLCAL